MLVVGTRRDRQGPAPVQHYQDADQAGAALAGTPAWRLGTTVVVGDTGTLGTSLLYKRAQHDISTAGIIYMQRNLLLANSVAALPTCTAQSCKQLHCT
jgi:hypothetical protein